MKLIKLFGLFILICLTFIYTDKVIDVAISQDPIMIKIKDYAKIANISPINASIYENTIIPGSVGKYIDEDVSYKAMKKIGYYEPTLLSYKSIYPEISIYNSYNKYIIKGNTKYNNISLIYIIKNNNTIDNIISTIKKYNVPINFFIDANFLNNNIAIIDKLKDNEIYNYGNNGIYTKDNLIIANNIINNKANNNSIYCLFTKKDNPTMEICSNSKMLSLYVKTNNYYNIKSSLENGSLILIDNTQELNNIIEYIISKGYNLVPLSKNIVE